MHFWIYIRKNMLRFFKLINFRYELWKPYLRSMMEADMKSVSMGTKSKSEVLGNCLQQMKACFLDVSCISCMSSWFRYRKNIIILCRKKHRNCSCYWIALNLYLVVTSCLSLLIPIMQARVNKVKLLDAMGTFFARFDWVHSVSFYYCYKFLSSLLLFYLGQVDLSMRHKTP